MVDEPISSSARYRFTASHPQVQHALTSDFRRAYNSSCTLFRDSFIIRNGTRDRSFDLLPPLQPFEGCERPFARVLALRSTIDRHPSLFPTFWKRILIFTDWLDGIGNERSTFWNCSKIVLRFTFIHCFEIVNQRFEYAITYNFLELI